MGTPSKTSSAISPSKISLADTTPSKISSADTTQSKAASTSIHSMDLIAWKAKMDIQSQTTLPSMISSTTTSSKISSASYPQNTSNMSTSSMLEPSLSKI